MSIAIYPGSFDPPTLGHLDIIQRSAAIFDELVVCIMHNGAKERSLFTCEERSELLKKITADMPNVRVDIHGGLLVDYIKLYDEPVVIRGLRAVTDLEYEFQMAGMNRQLMPEVETVFMTPSLQNQFVSGTFVREIARLGGDEAAAFVDPRIWPTLQSAARRNPM